MSTNWKNIFEVALLGTSLLAGAPGCGEDEEKDEGAEAGCPGSSDAGCPASSDAGCPGSADAGCPGSADAGCPGSADAGCPGSADAGCPGSADAGCPGAKALPEDPAEWTAWLDEKSYESWRCDETAQPPLSDSPHGNNIICVNDELWAARDAEGAYPVGAAAVKLVIGNDGNVGTRYIDARLKADEGAAGWYFYVDGSGPSGFGDEEPVTFCADCHDNQGARDYVRRIPN